jgi:hypothetical protein
MNLSILELAKLIEDAYFCEGYMVVCELNNGLVVAVVSYGDDSNISVQICDEGGNTEEVIYELPEVLDNPIDWNMIAKMVKDYIKANKLKIVNTFTYNESAYSDKFNKLYMETINNLQDVVEPRKFEFCLQKLNAEGTGVLDEFQTVTEFGIDGHEAYDKVRAAYPGWKVFTWGIFEN